MNLPTDKLRTLVALADKRSFSKAAKSLSTTQPNVSVHIRKLQNLLGYQLLDKSIPGVCLTPRGELVVNRARQFFAIHDHMLSGGSFGPCQLVRMGIPTYYAGQRIPEALIRFRRKHPAISYDVANGPSEEVLRKLSVGELDLALALSMEEPKKMVRYVWSDTLVWVRAKSTKLNPKGPVPLVSYGPDTWCYRAAVDALTSAGRDFSNVLFSRDIEILKAGVEAGLGTSVLPRKRAIRNSFRIWEESPLPVLPKVFAAILVRDGSDPTAVELADCLMEE